VPPPFIVLETHPAQDTSTSWNHSLDNLQVLFQPDVDTYLFLPWLQLLSSPHT
jgi:hypothetical protein